MTDKQATKIIAQVGEGEDFRALKANGQQKGYLVLTEEERAKGFLRPVRRSYVHRGVRPQYPLRALTEKELEQFKGFDYVAFEPFPESERPKTGQYWTAAQLASGCGAVTTMSQEIAETYARDPGFYGSTFCCACGAHLPVAQFVWDGTDDVVGS